MQRFALYHFSGTGNTAWLADRLTEALAARGAEVSSAPIVRDDAPRLPDGPNTLVLCFPVYGLDAPPLVQEWSRRLPAGEGRGAVVVRSPGDPFFEGGTTRTMRRIVEERGWRVRVERMIVMPANVFVRVSDDLAALLLAAARRRIGKLAADIMSDKELLEDTGTFVHYCSRFCNQLLGRYGHRFGWDLSTTAACVRCGLCARECPAHSITMGEKGPLFGDRCAVCLRCLAHCPQKAIPSRFYKRFSVEKYDLAALDAAGPEGREPRTWFERRYGTYLREAEFSVP